MIRFSFHFMSRQQSRRRSVACVVSVYRPARHLWSDATSVVFVECRQVIKNNPTKSTRALFSNRPFLWYIISLSLSLLSLIDHIEQRECSVMVAVTILLKDFLGMLLGCYNHNTLRIILILPPISIVTHSTEMSNHNTLRLILILPPISAVTHSTEKNNCYVKIAKMKDVLFTFSENATWITGLGTRERKRERKKERGSTRSTSTSVFYFSRCGLIFCL